MTSELSKLVLESSDKGFNKFLDVCKEALNMYASLNISISISISIYIYLYLYIYIYIYIYICKFDKNNVSRLLPSQGHCMGLGGVIPLVGPGTKPQKLQLF